MASPTSQVISTTHLVRASDREPDTATLAPETKAGGSKSSRRRRKRQQRRRRRERARKERGSQGAASSVPAHPVSPPPATPKQTPHPGKSLGAARASQPVLSQTSSPVWAQQPTNSGVSGALAPEITRASPLWEVKFVLLSLIANLSARGDSGADAVLALQSLLGMLGPIHSILARHAKAH